MKKDDKFGQNCRRNLLPHERKNDMNMKMTKVTYFIARVLLNIENLFQRNCVLRESKGILPRELCPCKWQEDIHMRKTC